MRDAHRHWTLLTLVGVAALAGACQGRSVLDGAGRVGRGAPASSPSGVVQLSARDLAPVDAYIYHHNAQWILGDVVEIVASREYFGQNLTVNRSMGHVERVDTQLADETRVVLRYYDDGLAPSVTTNPRVLIGTGLTVSARKRLTVRLVKTRDPNRPVHLRVHALGMASHGRKDQVLQRAHELTIGGEIRKTADGRWGWRTFE